MCVRALFYSVLLRLSGTSTQPIDWRIKSAVADSHVISLLRRLALYTSLHFVDHIKRQSHKFNELFTYKSKEKCKHLKKFSTPCAITQSFYEIFSKKTITTQKTIHKMKDLVNENTLTESNSVVVDQKSAYHNGISNGDR